jgi:hypothetical protein
MICFLRHAARPALRALPPADAAARLFARTFPPIWDATAVTAVLNACAEIAASTPCYEFRFRPDRTAVDMVVAELGRLRTTDH